ncbi:Peptidyl-prolyl cis-trans isomerase CYP26-2 chloroplastic [Bienertia sinuspersici]
MLQQLKLTQPPTQIIHNQKPPNITQNQSTPISHSPPIPKQCSKFSRRELTIFTNSSLLLLTSQAFNPHPLSEARAEENLQETDEPEQQAKTSAKNSSECTERNPTKQVFLDISIDGKPTGRIVIGLYEENAPVGAARFSDLVSGKAGITFRRKEFVKIMPNYVQHGGIRSYGVDAELASRTGSNFGNESLIDEWERMNEECLGTKNLAGRVSIIVRNPSKPPPKEKLVARGGKLEIDKEEVGVEPNGTEFTIARRDSPELDSSGLVVGKVIEGMDVLEKIGQSDRAV